MRQAIYGINLTADGCCDHTKGIPSEELMYYYTDLFNEVDLIVWGRKTYELMIPYWPEVLNDPTSAPGEIAFAKALVETPKVVVSRTLQSADYNTTVMRGDLREEFQKLKQEGGKKISLGGVSVPEQLIEMGLVDEFRFVILPTIAGEGRRLLNATSIGNMQLLDLTSTKQFENGSIALHYKKRQA
jgi:dihydrofolate reductase